MISASLPASIAPMQKASLALWRPFPACPLINAMSLYIFTSPTLRRLRRALRMGNGLKIAGEIGDGLSKHHTYPVEYPQCSSFHRLAGREREFDTCAMMFAVVFIFVRVHKPTSTLICLYHFTSWERFVARSQRQRFGESMRTKVMGKSGTEPPPRRAASVLQATYSSTMTPSKDTPSETKSCFTRQVPRIQI